jgi:hypothetical protein
VERPAHQPRPLAEVANERAFPHEQHVDA